jgi:uncharacterized phage protein (TIGR02218 family)
MRTISPALAAHLAGEATTLARCWIARRADGLVLGFTDHDRDLTVAGVICRAATGLDAAEAESLAGFAVGGTEVAGALSSAAITEADVLAGRWDGATVETWIVNWQDAGQALLMDLGAIGEIRRQGEAFSAEIRSLAQRLDVVVGRRYQALCDAEFGDERCGRDAAAPEYRLSSAIVGVVDAATFTIAAPGAFAAGAFGGGRAVIAGGPPLAVMSHTRIGALDRLVLWAPPAAPLGAGQTVTLTVGCDKRFGTCRDRFGNALNYRGFPHIPGNEALQDYARAGQGGTGTPVVP